MSKCPICGSPEHPSWKAHVFVGSPIVNKPVVNTVNTAVNKRPVNTDRKAYMREYMKARRARQGAKP